jgi:hypothetical protein
MDPEAPQYRPISTDRPLSLDDLHGAEKRTRSARVAALLLGLLLAVLAAGLLTLSSPRSTSRPAPGAGVTASAVVQAPDGPGTPSPPAEPDDPDGPLPDRVD